jgi:hypothetical protein
LETLSLIFLLHFLAIQCIENSHKKFDFEGGPLLQQLKQQSEVVSMNIREIIVLQHFNIFSSSICEALLTSLYFEGISP